ncbi:MAG: hypothetical protein IJO54_06910 [Oscillospiraceae bacterium]|nr:hypothetical protein [Oscillospiraceae bacterium]
MALVINGIKASGCNVIKNGQTHPCKKINVNGVNVWNSEYLFFPSEYACVKDNWTSSGSGNFEVSETSMYFYSSTDGSSRTLPALPVDFSKYRTLHMEISAYNNNSKFIIRWRRTEDNGTAVSLAVDDLAEEERVGVHSFDIADINDTCYFCINGDHGGGGTITKIWFEE